MLIFFLLSSTFGCNVYCPSDWQGDGYCDLQCMTVPCNFDNGDCLSQCAATGCTLTASNGICDSQCNSQICGLDFGDCGYCTSTCTQALYLNSICNEECNDYICNLDNGKCDYCAVGCTLEKFLNSVCDSECNNYDCYFDYYNCQCSPGCDNYMISDGYCDEDCLTYACGYDGEDSSLCNIFEIYVDSSASGYMDGTADYPYDDLIFAILQLTEQFNTIYLLSGDFFINNLGSQVPFYNVYAAFIEIKPYYCTQGAIHGCFNTGERPKLTFTDQLVYIDIYNQLNFIDVIFSHDYEFDIGCPGCNYCPYTDTDSDGNVIDDRGNILLPSTFLDMSYCSQYENFDMIRVAKGGELYLENVDFQDMRMKYKSIIGIYQGTVELVNVNFINIAVSKNGFVIQNYQSTPDGFMDKFTYDGGVVQLVNNGYELISQNNLGNFISFSQVKKVSFANVQFSFNIFNGDNSALISLSKVYIATFENLNFKSNYSPNNLIKIDQSSLEMPLDTKATYQNTTNIHFSNTIFVNNSATSLIQLKFNKDCQNIVFASNSFEFNFGFQNLIDIEYQGQLSNICINGGFKTIKNVFDPVHLNPAFFNFSNSTFTSNYASNLISVTNLNNFTANSLEFLKNGESFEVNTATIDSIQAFPNSYISLDINSTPVILEYLISLYSIDSILFTDNTISQNLFPLLSIESAKGQVVLSSSEFSENKASSNMIEISSKVAVELQELIFSHNVLTGVTSGMLVLTRATLDVVYTLSDSSFSDCSNGIKVQGVSIALKNILVTDSIALSYSLLYMVGNNLNRLHISDCTVTRGIGAAIKVITDDYGILDVTLDNIKFSHITTFAIIGIDQSVQLTPTSYLNFGHFSYNSANLIMLAIFGGSFTVKNSYFGYNLLNTYFAVGLLNNRELLIQNCEFAFNTGISLQSGGIGYIATVITENCNFHDNIGKVVNVIQGIYSDKASVFLNNYASKKPILKINDNAKVNLTGSVFENNSVSGNGMISVIADSEIVISLSSFVNNSATLKGGVLFVDQNGTYTISDSEFLMNSALQGACIYSQHSLIPSFINNSKFALNSAITTGCITVLESQLNILNSIIANNTALYSSGLEILYYSDVSITDSQFSYHIGEGAHITAEGLSIVTVENTSFSNSFSISGCSAFKIVQSSLTCKACTVTNATTYNDKAIYCEKSICEISNSKILDIYSGTLGSVISLDNYSILSLTYTSIHDFIGSGIYIGRYSGATISNSLLFSKTYIDGESAAGAGVYCDTCEGFNISESNFQRLYSDTFGGALLSYPYKNGYQNIILSSSFTDCSAYAGGALYLDNTNLLVNKVKFANNSALQNEDSYSGQGGGIYLEYSLYPGTASLLSSTFVENSAKASGGGVQWYNSQPIIEDCSFENNEAYYGANIGSFPNQISLNQNRQLNNFEFPPGQTIPDPIIAFTIDHYGQTVTTDDYTPAEIIVSNFLEFSITGNNKVTASSGMLNFSNFAITGPPGSSTSLEIIGDFSMSGSGSVDLNIEVILRDCIEGEAIVSNSSCVVCISGYYNLEPGVECKKCPTGGICYGGKNIAAASGYWRPSKISDAFFACPNSNACLEETIEEGGEHCADGYEGNLCQSCIIGYSRNGENTCVKCLDNEKNTLVLVGLLVLAVCLISFLTSSNIKGAYKEQSITSIYFKILMNYLQIVMLTISFDLNWPALVLTMFSAQSKVAGSSDQLFSIDCYIGSSFTPYYAKLILLAVIPAVCAAFSLLFWIVFGKIRKSTNLKEKIIGSIVVQLFFFQPSLVKFNFSMFNCMELTPGDYYMTQDMSIKCWESEHMFYTFGLVLPSIGLWCIGIPLALVIILCKNKANLAVIDSKLKYGFLYKGFKPDKFYWEFLIMLRKILIISCSVFLKNFSIHLQALATFIVVLISYVIQEKFKPYNVSQLNKMEIKSIVVSAVTMYSGLFFLTGDLNESMKIMLFSLMVLSNAMFLSYWMYYTFGFYFGKIYLKCSCCKRLFRNRLNAWVSSVVPVEDLVPVDNETKLSTILQTPRISTLQQKNLFSPF